MARYLARSKVWREEYRRSRYLRGLSDGDVGQRFLDVFGNATTLADDGKLGFVARGSGAEFWMPLHTHVLEELKLRSLGMPKYDKDFVCLPEATWPRRAPGGASFGSHRLDGGPSLLKYTQLQFATEALEHGRIQINIASNYKRASFNIAIRDDELCFRYMRTISKRDHSSILGPDGNPLGDRERFGVYVHECKTDVDYHVLCLSLAFDRRMFGNFDADACLVVRDRTQFHRRLTEAVDRHLPGWKRSERVVSYVDPARDHWNGFLGCFSKHFRYAYQREYRYVWGPPEGGRQELHPFVVELGSLRDIAEVIPADA